ncbi:MAG: hypothetical protein HY538_08340 [Deltaproteobacteria bacterium]|nr:hypothetical protein [Deltaproteobacteria bacterium]
MIRTKWRIGLFFVLISTPVPFANAFYIQTVLSSNCHEKMTASALGSTGFLQTPPSPTHYDEVLFDNLQFDAGPFSKDIFTISLVIGARWNDLHGNSSIDIDELQQVHNTESHQREHCLRQRDQDGEQGNVEAIEDCKDFIREMFENILTTATATGSLGPTIRGDFPEYILYRGTMDVSLSVLYFNAGRAIHAIQDSFSHVYRTFTTDSATNLKVIETVLNWPDYVRGEVDESRDGPEHSFTLDDCECDRTSSDVTVDTAIEASTEFLALLSDADPSNPDSLDARRARLETFLTDWFTVQPGCNADNNFCSNASHVEADVDCGDSNDKLGAESVLGCQVSDSDRSTDSRFLGGVFVLLLALVPWFLWRQKKRI